MTKHPTKCYFVFIFKLQSLLLSRQSSTLRCHFHSGAYLIHLLTPVQRKPTGTQCSYKSWARTCTTKFCTVWFERHSYLKKSCSRQGTILSMFSKCHFSSNLNNHLTDEIFSQERRKLLIQGLSKVRFSRRTFQKKALKHAGVLVPLCTVGGEPALLMTLRSRNLSQHRGEVSFPGGMQDDGDANIIQTALREGNEELGIKLQDVDVWCQTPAVPNKSGDTAVVAVVGFIGEVDVNNLLVNKREVESAFTIPISVLLNPVNQSHSPFIPDQTKHNRSPVRHLPVFLGGGHKVWGLSAIILDGILQAWLPQYYTSFAVRMKKGS